MHRVILGALLMLAFVPLSDAFSQGLDTQSKLIILQSSDLFVYEDDDGYTVVVGSVENNYQFAITNIQIQVNFLDSFDNRLTSVLGTTHLDMVPPGGESTFLIRSDNPSQSYWGVEIEIIHFDTINEKSLGLGMAIQDIAYHDLLEFTAVVQNGKAPSGDVRVHAAFYDEFSPPRILDVVTISLDDMGPDEMLTFAFRDAVDPRAVAVQLFAESDIFYAEPVQAMIPERQALEHRISISGTSLTDDDGQRITDAAVGSAVGISSTLSAESINAGAAIPYVSYTQVIAAGDGRVVEFLGSYGGELGPSGTDTASVEWLPERPGLYFIETYVWDADDNPIANKGPIVLVLVSGP